MSLQKKPLSASEMQEIKQKTSKLMKEYELQIIEKEFHKQKLKQNVMLEIMSNRQKKQSASQSTSKQTTSQGQRTTRQNQLSSFPVKKVVDSRMAEYNSPSDRISDRMNQKEGIQTLLRKSHTLPNDEKQLRKSIVSERKQQSAQQINDVGEITFNQKNNNLDGSKVPLLLRLPKNSLQNDDNDSNENRQVKQSKVSRQNNSHENRSAQNNYRKEFPTFRDSKKRIILNENQLYKDHNHEQKHQEQDQYQMPHNQQNQQEYQQQSHHSSQNRGQQISNYNKVMGNQSFQSPQQREFEETYQKGIFLTVEQNQSQFTQANKNCAFDILMDKSDANQNLDQLKKKKLIQLQKKRAFRMEQFKKQEEAKKQERSQSAIQKTKYSQIHGHKKSQKSLHQDDQNQTVRSNTNISNTEKNKKAVKTNEKPPRNVSGFNNGEQSIVSKVQNTNPPSVKRISQQDSNERKGIFGNTPKTVSTTKNKEKRSNIFAQSPSGGRDKSASKYNNDPKIEPKTVKNGFIRQSNKKLMITAITYVCLPGQLNRKHRQQLIQVLQNESSSDYFIFLFKEYSRKVIKGIYILDIQEDRIRKIYGDKAPAELYSDQVHSFYRFDSGSREFKGIDGCKSFSLAVNAVDLK